MQGRRGLRSRAGGRLQRVRPEVEIRLDGKVATMGQGVLQDVSGCLIGTFAQNLAAILESAPEPEAAAGPARETASAERQDALDLGSLGGAVVADRLKDPKALAGVVLFALLLLFLLGRRRR
jgi:hypothetical protein